MQALKVHSFLGLSLFLATAWDILQYRKLGTNITSTFLIGLILMYY